MVAVRIAQLSDIGRVVDAYRAWGYRHGVSPEDTIWLAEDGEQLIGVVRIAAENGTFVLRGMRIAEAWRGRGIGTQMLSVLAAWLGNRECFCVPYDHLTAFYGQIGFVEIAPEVAPGFLAARLGSIDACLCG